MGFSNLLQSVTNQKYPLPWAGHWIAGRWDSGQEGTIAKSSLNPSSGESIMTFYESKQSVLRAVDFASESENTLRSLTPQQRIDTIGRLAQTLSDYHLDFQKALQIETGKPAWEAKSDLDSSIRYLRWVSEHGPEIYDRLLEPAKIFCEGGSFRLLPLGTTVAYLPFSTPVTSFVVSFTAAALAGCPLILFSSTHAAVVCSMFAHCVEALDLPKGLLQLVFGGYENFRMALSDKRVAAVLFTGSREHCEQIRSESGHRPGRQLVLQSGGKNAALIHKSADLDLAVRHTVTGMCKSAGQLCSSTSRAFVDRSLISEFKSKLVAALNQITVGPTDRYSDDIGPHMGPLFSRKSVEKFLRFQTMASRESEENLLWGKTLSKGDTGFFVTPGAHIMKAFGNSGAYQGNVIMAPDLAIYPYDDLSKAIHQINDTDSIFATSFFGTKDVLESNRQHFLTPNLLLNLPTVEVEASLPLAGRFSSGQTRFQGPALALYLSYPQVISDDDELRQTVVSWPQGKV